LSSSAYRGASEARATPRGSALPTICISKGVSASSLRMAARAGDSWQPGGEKSEGNRGERHVVDEKR
jgi:hypothetical protein